MVQPKFKHPDKFQQLPHRDWLRENKPHGKRGYVVEDLDLLLRVYGEDFDADGVGKFILVELKFRNAWIGPAQRKTFGLVDAMLRYADPGRRRYLGYFVVQYYNEDWDKAKFRINKVKVTREEFVNKFLNLDEDFLSSLPSILPVVPWREYTYQIKGDHNDSP